MVTILDLDADCLGAITAFLNADFEEIIFMEVPEGLRDPSKPNLARKLLKALYGLDQSPRQWYAKIHAFLVDDSGFVCYPSET